MELYHQKLTLNIRPTKSQAIQIVSTQAPQMLEIFRTFQAFKGCWLIWPQRLLQIKSNLKLDNYVTLYEDKRRIDNSLYLYFKGEDAVLAENEAHDKLSPEAREQYVIDLAQELIDIDLTEFEESLPNLNPTKEEEELSKAEFEALSESEKVQAIKKVSYLYLFLFSSLHNYFSIMVCGEALTSLVPKALKGDDEAFYKAVKIDRNLLLAHPYFTSRYQKAQELGDRSFLERIAVSQSIPSLKGKIALPGIYVVFAMLESIGWLDDDMLHREILDICDVAGLDRWQNRVESVDAVTKQLARYRRYQKTGGVSMH